MWKKGGGLERPLLLTGVNPLIAFRECNALLLKDDSQEAFALEVFRPDASWPALHLAISPCGFRKCRPRLAGLLLAIPDFKHCVMKFDLIAYKVAHTSPLGGLGDCNIT